ncbi:HEPN domain-containing protein [Flavobacterium sp. HXWNR29]|uniref:HEPN domain-containing protein n=1 Tax=Flavobacterium odoriferum TaxID=2946604 RepID=UPI0021CB6E9A|nr:HEPN domain-containing protein [Flavobacterium sp. HXWNR29]MCU4188479.1 HEPN domain-containing protein [Flavobacterium sp. HXWNR29]
MNETNLENKAYNFVQKVKIFEDPKKTNDNQNWKGSSSHLGVIDLSDKIVDNDIIVREYMSDLSDYKIYIIRDSIRYGFIESDYYELYKFVYELSEWNNIQQNVSIEYLKEKIISWIVDVHINNVSRINLFIYLDEKLKKDINKYRFCFPILNIDIEKDFNIGDSKIMYFSKEYFDEFYKFQLSKIQSSEEYSEEIFNKLYRKYQGQVFVAIDVFAESKKAEIIAYENACFIVDVLKICGPTIQFPNEVCYLELESRMPFSYNYLRFKNDNHFDFSITTKVNRQQMLPFDSKLVNSYKVFFDEFGRLINSKYNSEMEKIVKNSLIFFSKCISETDLHLRISQLIMILESIFLLDEEKYKMENKAKRRFIDFRFNSNTKEKNDFSEILTEMYQVRHKMTHKSIRIYIDYKKLRIFQIEMINLFYSLLKQCNMFNSKELLITYLDEKANPS